VGIAETLENEVQASILTLLEKVTCEKPDVRLTHTVCRVGNLAVDDELCRAIGRHALAQQVPALDAAMRVQTDLVPDGQDMSSDIVSEMRTCCGSDLAGEEFERFKLDRRNPWLSESLALMLMHAAQTNEPLHPVGSLRGAWTFHMRATDPGLDVATLYERAGTWGLGVIEAKACENNATSAMQDAVRYFEEVDAGQHNGRLRQAATQLAPVLTEEERETFSMLLFKRERAYLANAYYESGLRGTTWKKARPTCGKLDVDREHIVILACPIVGFADFFDQVAAEVLIFAEELAHV